MNEDFISNLIRNLPKQITDKIVKDLKEVDGEKDQQIKQLIILGEFLSKELKDILYSKSRRQKKTRREIAISATKYVFELRKFFTGQELEFVIGGTTPEGNLETRTVKQDELLEHIASHLGKTDKAIHILEGEIKNLYNGTVVSQGILSHWAEILEYAHIDIDDPSTKHFYENNKEESYYGKARADVRVWLLFKTSKSKNNYANYYYQLSENFIRSRKDIAAERYFNRGWLYEWAQIYANENPGAQLPANNAPLYPLVATNNLDNIPGISGGDWQNQQYKYGNTQLITYKNIVNILDGGGKGDYANNSGIIQNLKDYLNNNYDESKIENIVEGFFLNNKEELNRVYNKNSNTDILQPFKENIEKISAQQFNLTIH